MQEKTINKEQYSLKKLKAWYTPGIITDWDRILNLVERMGNLPLKKVYQSGYRKMMSPVDEICSFLKRDGLIADEEKLKNEGTYREMLGLVKAAYVKRQTKPGVWNWKADPKNIGMMKIDHEFECRVLPAVAEIYLGFWSI